MVWIRFVISVKKIVRFRGLSLEYTNVLFNFHKIIISSNSFHMTLPSQEYGICNKYSMAMYVGDCFCCSSVFLSIRYFPLMLAVDVFSSVSVYNPDLFCLNLFLTFEQQRYATVAFS